MSKHVINSQHHNYQYYYKQKKLHKKIKNKTKKELTMDKKEQYSG